MSREFQDRAFQRLSETPENLFEFLRIISPELAKTLDPETVEKLDSVIVSLGEEKVTEDRLFRVKSKGPENKRYGFLVLMAHQSSNQKEMYLRLLKAYVLLLEREIREDTDESNHNFWPIVIHTGEKKWRILTQRERQAKSLRKRKASEEEIKRITRKTPDFEIEYLDLAAAEMTDLERLVSFSSEVGCFLGFMGARRDVERSNKILSDILEQVNDNRVTGRVSHLLASIELLIRHSQPEKTAKSFSNRIRKSLREEVEADMEAKVKTWGEEIEEQVRLEALHQGKLESLRESIKGFISKLFPDAPEKETLKRLNNENSPTRLQFILNRAFDWQSYEDVWTLPDDQKD